MFYLSAATAILGAVTYQYFVKRVPPDINPIMSVLGVYLAVLAFSLALLVIFPPEGGFGKHFGQLSWIQLAIAGAVFLIELGFLLMYRSGWNLSIGNLVTGIFINILLVGLGVALLGEKVSLINAFGIALSILGVTLISYRP